MIYRNFYCSKYLRTCLKCQRFFEISLFGFSVTSGFFIRDFTVQPFLNCGYMNTCVKCGQKFLCKGHKDQFSTFETCIHITAFKTLLYNLFILIRANQNEKIYPNFDNLFRTGLSAFEYFVLKPRTFSMNNLVL